MVAEQSTQSATSPRRNVESRSVAEKCEKLGFQRSQLSRQGSFCGYAGGDIGRTGR